MIQVRVRKDKKLMMAQSLIKNDDWENPQTLILLRNYSHISKSWKELANFMGWSVSLTYSRCKRYNIKPRKKEQTDTWVDPNPNLSNSFKPRSSIKEVFVTPEKAVVLRRLQRQLKKEKCSRMPPVFETGES